MATSTNNLTDIGLGPGNTANFHVEYEDTLANQPQIIQNANALLTVVEGEFTALTGPNFFNIPNPANKFGAAHRQVVNLSLGNGGGANNRGYISDINVDSQNNTVDSAATRAGRVEMVFMAEWSEILMSIVRNWNAGDSSGEGLSQYCTIVRFQNAHYTYYGSWVKQWMDQNPRPDFVTKTEGTDGNAISFGCALAFIYYLEHQLSFSIAQIIAAYDTTLAKCYQNLTGDPGNPFPFFAALLEHVYPTGAPGGVAIPGPVIDDPFPLAFASFINNKDTYGKDEVQDIIANHGGVFSKAFFIQIDGFSKNSFLANNIQVAPFTGAFTHEAGVTITLNPDIDFENATQPQAPQRIRVPFDVTFTTAALADFPATAFRQDDLSTFLTAGGAKIVGSDASTLIELVAGADPSFQNIDTTAGDPNQNNAFFLSQDLRVFTATPALNNTPVPGGPVFGADSITGAFQYTQALLTYLNANFSDPAGADPFNTALPNQVGALQGDSSVNPFTISLTTGFPFGFTVSANYSFAIARVRLTGIAGTTTALNTRVFFRLWTSQSPDTDYQPNTTYQSSLDAKGLPASPNLGVSADTLTIPFFATGNLTNNTDYGAGGANTRDIKLATGHDETWAYFGCFLNVYDATNMIGGQPVQAALIGTHHCLVAQIAFDDAPIILGASPAASDKLAQRNLQVTHSDNPGGAETHRVPQTFDIRATAPDTGLPPDELMIDWGDVPVGSFASIFWPQVNAADVIALANKNQASHSLTVVDSNSIGVKVTSGVSYIPIPTGTSNFAGLFTLDLPQSVTFGQTFAVKVRRLSSRTFRQVIIESPRPTHASAAPSAPSTAPATGSRGAPGVHTAPPSTGPDTGGQGPQGPDPNLFIWRYVVGSFTVQIPVATPDTILPIENNILAIMRYRLQNLSPTSRWRPVVTRYIKQIAERVDGLGGNSISILPSPNGAPAPFVEHCGKVTRVLFDCHGDLVGFVLDECGTTARTFAVCGPKFFELLLRACKDGLTICVTVDTRANDRMVAVAIKCC